VALSEAIETREQQIRHFLQQCALQSAARDAIAADASFRSYERLEKDNHHFILMNAPAPQEDIRPFTKVCHLLTRLHLSAPAMFCQDVDHGFMLLEDLGRCSYNHHLREHPEDEYTLYHAALQVQLVLRAYGNAIRFGTLPPYDMDVYLREVLLYAEWYLPQLLRGDDLFKAQESYIALWKQLLAEADFTCSQPVLRDFHADNLMWLPQRDGAARAGLLDFQDALLGDSTYDLVSLLEDARRDVAPDTQERIISDYLEATGEDENAFRRRYALMAAQRNSKVIGIFHRLAARDGKHHYLDFVPRVQKLLEGNLQHPALQPLKEWHQRYLP
jgi:aminoglycoside/choline kinase family phosphotransferase